MVWRLLLSFFVASFSLMSSANELSLPLVDLHRYMGTWYEIAAFPQWFQTNCVASKAKYTLNEDGTVAVVNSCTRKLVGGQQTAKGTARVVDSETNAKLKVKFKYAPTEGDYWIIALDDNYQWAVVGHPEKKYLWILSRVPYMNQAFYDNLVVELREKHGYDVSKLKVTLQPAVH